MPGASGDKYGTTSALAVGSTARNPTDAPRCFWSAAMVSSVSDAARNRMR